MTAAELEQVWKPYGAAGFLDRRMLLRRGGGIIRQNVRAFHGVIVRQGEGRRQIFDRCPHAHIKQAAARKCAEAAAKRLNRALARGETWPLEVGT